MKLKNALQIYQNYPGTYLKKNLIKGLQENKRSWKKDSRVKKAQSTKKHTQLYYKKCAPNWTLNDFKKKKKSIDFFR